MKKVLFSMAICLAASSMFFSCGGDDDGGGGNTDPQFGTFTDQRDNTEYKTVTIGTQTWMAENLNYQGTVSQGTISCYNNSQINCDTLGALYDFEAAQEACPPGSHLPSDSEWTTLEMALGMTQEAADSIGWRGEGVGTEMKKDTVNLELAGLYQYTYNCACYDRINKAGAYWSSTVYSDTASYYRQVTIVSYLPTTKVYRDAEDKRNRLSIRCIID